MCVKLLHIILVFIKGILAGLSISVGAICFILITSINDSYYCKFLGSVAFSIGLFIVCLCYLSLYTGQIGKLFSKYICKPKIKNSSTQTYDYEEFYILTPTIYRSSQTNNANNNNTQTFHCWIIENEFNLYEYCVSLFVMLVANLLSSCVAGILLNKFFKDSATDFFATVDKIAQTKLKINYILTPMNGILCGMCVKRAVTIFAENRLTIKGTFYLVFFVTIFVFFGFEHCIANMFYFSCANTLSNENTYVNLLIIIFCNSIGSWLV